MSSDLRRIGDDAESELRRFGDEASGDTTDEADRTASSASISAAGAAKYAVRFSGNRARRLAAKGAGSLRRLVGRHGANRAVRGAASAASNASARAGERAARRAARGARRLIPRGFFVKAAAAVAAFIATFAVVGGVLLAMPTSLSDAELSVAAHLYAKGYTTEAIAGIMGNLKVDGYFDGGLFQRKARAGEFDVTRLSWKPGEVKVFEGVELTEDDLPASFEAMSKTDSVTLSTWAVMLAYSKPLLMTDRAFQKRLSAAQGYRTSLLHGVDARMLKVLTCAHSQIGVAYIWGWARPYVGLDCSGLTMWCYSQAGMSIPKHSEAQARALEHIPLEEARAGDILWRQGHVAIYIGDNRYIHAMDEDHGVLFGEGRERFTCALRWTD